MYLNITFKFLKINEILLINFNLKFKNEMSTFY